MNWKLSANKSFAGPSGPVLLVILDGVGVGSGDEGDAVRLAATPNLDALSGLGLYRTLRAHGKAVGLPTDDDMGNSEVGHNAMGSGRIYEQGAALVGAAIASGDLFRGKSWRALMERCAGPSGGALHFLGLLSDGNVHSHIHHLIAMLDRAASEGCRRLYVHVLTDGRDTPPLSALVYVDQLEAALGRLRASGCDAAIASGGGRMVITMDRYEANWEMVARGWEVHVHGQGRRFASTRQAIETLRAENPGANDQNLPPFVIERNGAPLAPIQNGDGVICFNFRGDRAMEISRAFDDGEEFKAFDRGFRPEVMYAGMMEYDGNLLVPRHYLVEPPAIEETMGEYLAKNGVSQLAISETQKFGHVTYFWNGNRSGKFDDAFETYVEIRSDRVPYEQRPWMKAAEITDRLVEELHGGKHRFARVNYANGDMVGHTGCFPATRVAVEVLDLQLGRLARAIEQTGGILVITADHGNADEMFQIDREGRVVRESASGEPVVKTSHTLNPVPFIVYDPKRSDRYRLVPGLERAGISNLTATCYELLGFSPPGGLEPSLIQFK